MKKLMLRDHGNLNKGITLIALIITIIVLLILVGVVLAMVVGENGILNKSTIARDKTNYSDAREGLQLLLADLKAEIVGNEKRSTVIKDLDRLRDKDFVETIEYKSEQASAQIIDVENPEYALITYKNYIFTVDREFRITNQVAKNNNQGGGNIDSSNNSILGKVSDIKRNGIQTIEANGKTYSANVIYVNKNLTLKNDGSAANSIDNLSFADGTYTVGNAGTDCATSDQEADMAKNMVILKVEGNLTIDQGVTLTACKNENGYGGPKGMLIYCTGTLKNNGTISMTARGAYAKGENVYLWKNSDNVYEFVSAKGALGGAPIRAYNEGQQGILGTGRKTGGRRIRSMY